MNQDRTIISILKARADKQPEHIAYTFLQDGKFPTQSLTYWQLKQKVTAIAAQIQKKVDGNHHCTVLLLYPNDLEFLSAFLGCLAADVIAVPTPALESYQLKRALPRISTIIKDAQPSLILTTSKLVTKLSGKVPLLKNINWIATDEICSSEEASISSSFYHQKTAYLQYTSGSTSAPKGVMVSHQNLMHNLGGFVQKSAHDASSVCATWLPFFHDYGLIYGLLQPLYVGIPCYVMSPFAFLKNPLNWLQAISDHHVTHSASPNFAFDYCLEQITSEHHQSLNLKSWRVAHTGSETVRYHTLKKFADTFAPCGFDFSSFYPGYGLAEATLIATTKSSHQPPRFLTISPQALNKNLIQEAPDGIFLMSCGQPIQGTDLAIVDPDTDIECAPKQVGEILLASASIAQGYWHRELETRQIFKTTLANRGEKTFLRTGDLGFIKDGELFVTGRIKELIVIRGENYYPQDIELVLQQCHSQLRTNSGAAFSIEIKGKEELIVFHEVERKNSQELQYKEIISIIRKVILQEYEISVYAICLLRRGHLPKTSSGKIQRNLCRQMFLDGTVESLFDWKRVPSFLGEGIPKNKIESQLLGIFEEITKLQVIGVEDNIFDLGIDSLLFLPLFTQIEKQFKITISFEKLIENPTISRLASFIKKDLSLSSQKPAQIRINCFKIISDVCKANLTWAEKKIRIYNIIKVQFLQTGPDFLDYTLPYNIGSPFIYWFCGQKWIQKIFFHKRVKSIEQCLELVDLTIPLPRSKVIQHNLASNFWRYWRLSSLAALPEHNFHRWTSIMGYSHFKKAHQEGKGVILLVAHVPMRSLLILLLDRWRIKDFTIIGEHRYVMELLNLSHLNIKMQLHSIEVTKAILYAQLYQAQKTLDCGGVVIIAPDGLIQQPGIEKEFFKGKCYIGRGFIDLAISQQSIALFVDVSMQSSGVVQIQFSDPLAPSESFLEHTNRAEELADQYWKILKYLWQHDFGNVGWDAIDAFIAQFNCSSENSI